MPAHQGSWLRDEEVKAEQDVVAYLPRAPSQSCTSTAMCLWGPGSGRGAGRLAAGSPHLTGRIRKDRCRCLSAAAAAAAPARVPSFLLTPLPSCMQQPEVLPTTHPDRIPSAPCPTTLFVPSTCTPNDRRVHISVLTFASSFLLLLLPLLSQANFLRRIERPRSH